MKNCKPLISLISFLLFVQITIAYSKVEIGGPPYNFNFQETTIVVGQEGCMDVVVDNFMEISAFEFGFTFDTLLFNFIGIESTELDETLLLVGSPPGGPINEVSVGFASFFSNVSLPNNSIAFSLCFEAKGAVGDISEIAIGNLPNGNVAQIFTNDGGFVVPEFNLVSANLIIGEPLPPVEIEIDFQLPIYLEDAIGNKDSIIFGYDDLPESPEFGILASESTLGTTFSGIFESRMALYNYPLEEHIPDFQFFAYPQIIESKKMIVDYDCDDPRFFGENNSFMVVIKSNNWPITVSYDQSILQETCAPVYMHDCTPGGWFDACGGAGYGNISEYNLSDYEEFELNKTSVPFLTTNSDTLYAVFIRLNHAIFNSVNTKLLPSNVKFSPNPVQNKLYLQTELQNLNYTIINLQGQQMMQGEYQDHIDVNQMPSGVYFLQLTQGDDVYKAIKFMKD